jgi:L-2-hydroxyglutarate oxidase LhgO
VGLAVAAAVARAGRSVLVLEAEPGIARGVTSRNSEVVHAGIYYPADSLKTALCVAGRLALYPWCEARRVPHRRLGKLIVATTPEEVAVVEDLRARALANGVEGLELVGRAEIARLEPEVDAIVALHSSETGIVDAHAFCLSLQAEAEAAGAIVLCGRRVTALAKRSQGWRIEIAGDACEVIDAGCVVDAAGLSADAIASLAGLDVDALGWRLFPCKGDYFALAPGARVRLSRLVYPVPQQAGLGIHATLDLAGRVRFGPDTEYVDQLDYQVDPAKAEAFRAAARRYLPGLAGATLVPDYAGIRPKLAGPGQGFRDFVIEEASAHGAPGFIACLGIESPGLTAALAIGERVALLARP